MVDFGRRQAQLLGEQDGRAQAGSFFARMLLGSSSIERRLRLGSSSMLVVFLSTNGSAVTLTSRGSLAGSVAGVGLQFSENLFSSFTSLSTSSCPLLIIFSFFSHLAASPLSSFLFSFFSRLLFSELRMPRQRSMRSRSRAVVLNMERKQSHSEWMMASWMWSRSTVWQKRLKYSQIYPSITIFYIKQSNSTLMPTRFPRHRTPHMHSSLCRIGTSMMEGGCDFQLLCHWFRQQQVSPQISHPSPSSPHFFTISAVKTRFPAQYYYIAEGNSSILILTMKAKPIINDSNFPKVQSKQPLFIVRPKPSQARLQPPGALSREARSPTALEPPQRSIDECLACLELQINEEQPMPRLICLRVRDHLLALRLKFNPEQQTYNEHRKEIGNHSTLTRKQSTKFFRGQRTEACDENRNKENIHSTETLLTAKNKQKGSKDEYEFEIQGLEAKLRDLSQRLEQYEREQHSFQTRIQKLEEEVELQSKEKTELKTLLEEETRRGNDMEDSLRKQLHQMEQKHILLEKQKEAVAGCLAEREREIISLWQLLSH